MLSRLSLENSNSVVLPVILSGGSGTRLWPLSRQHYPKQFLPLANEQTLFQNTLQRLEALPFKQLPPLVVCNHEHRFLVAEQCREMSVTPLDILLEPEARNTTAAVASAVVRAQDLADKTGQAIYLLILAADHYIRDDEAFSQALTLAITAAEEGYVMTLGITPTSPHTGYGYLKQGALLKEGVYTLDAFVEKPNADTAAGYLKSGQYWWNSGMFLFKSSVMLSALQRCVPKTLAAIQQAMQNGQRDLDFWRLEPAAFAAVESTPIDKAVMEKVDNLAMVTLDAGWSDLGAWDAIFELESQPRDGQNNVTVGDTLLHNSQDNYVRAQSRLVAAVGVSDHVIIETADAVLVADKNKLDGIKHIVQQLQLSGRSESLAHRQVHQPWGWYDQCIINSLYQVRQVMIKPGAKIDLQRHQQRSEHWVVLQGAARVKRGDENFTLLAGESTFIPRNTWHELENAQSAGEWLCVIEIQVGNSQELSDIERSQESSVANVLL
jgi:mannose-1-phosphate guanylyltransferase/mannose-6-phosphate isomerase